MGCDGGTIPRRDELVRTKKKPEQKDKNAETVAKWKHCAITQDPLRKPIVACELGKLYNKEAVLEHLLLNKNKNTSEVAGHITKLCDVKELNLTEKPGFKPKSSHKGDEYVDFHDSRYICPVTGVEMNGKQRFYIIWKCGCVLSERAIREVKAEACHKCGKLFDEKDVIILNGTDEELENLKERMVERRRLAKLEKKKKKATSTDLGIKIKLEPEDSVASTSSASTSQKKIENCEFAKSNQDTPTEGHELKMKSELPNTTSCAPAAKAEIEKHHSVKLEKKNIMSQDGPEMKKMKLESDESNFHKNHASVNGVKKESRMKNEKVSSINFELPKKAQKSYSIAKDPSATAAYKSLFTSHASAKKQDKPHWITHNPLYY